ncbi:T9SS type A sorting domain-containing protein [Chryseobacterium sp. RR2-3-20]|uniref:T9SS type A sorting domain-containing protein n=1 Tax=Chryseobacterium sp. RR2-3-20 TaxID=2787626 RepID=UPI001ADFB2C7|nr:T9SS type A sorting domain-containing protein [Chryseobacterium sp. RR2-3-20]
MRKIVYFILFFICSFFSAQSFPYDRSWGTYVGGGGTEVLNLVDTKAFIVNQQDEVFVNAITGDYNNVYPASYHNQFAISSGGHAYDSSQQNQFLNIFSTNGTQLYGAYKGTVAGSSERLMAIDAQNNRYILKRFAGLVPNLATSGAWLSSPVGSINKTVVLYKYAPNGNVIYATYLPYSISVSCFADGDAVYVVGDVKQEIAGLSNPGVFQENYTNFGPSGLNGFYVKLSATGSKQIGTYFPTPIYAAYYNGGLYFWTDFSLSVQQSLVTPGTFQQSSGNQVLCKFNADTATLVWGTSIGVNNPSAAGSGIFNFNVNQNGIYLYGIADGVVGSYYATPGTYRTQILGGTDLFLNKFDDTGNRLWGTYFGGNGFDDIWGSGEIALGNNKIVVGGNTFGTDNMSTPGAFLATPPNNSYWGNVFFTSFDDSGNRQFCSYFGGAKNLNSTYGESINTSFDHAGNLYLWGSTTAISGIATSNGAYPNAINPQDLPFGYLVKFSPKESEMGTSETELLKDLVLYNNPNNGNFTLSGNVLEKQRCKVKIYDSAGRFLASPPSKKAKTQNFDMHGFLKNGIYMIHILDENDKNLKVFKMTVN